MKHSGKFVAYYRVSTAKQGVSGLGLEAQREAVAQYLNGGDWELCEEFVEIESGKCEKNRPQLAASLEACRKLKATLVIAKLDRLARDAGFLLTLRSSGQEIRAVDMPHAGTLEFGIRAVFAQHEREEISRRTKAALAAAKARGVELGANGRRLAQENKEAADGRAADVLPVINEIRACGVTTLQGIADELNRRGVPTARGGKWHITSTRRLLQRIGQI